VRRVHHSLSSPLLLTLMEYNKVKKEAKTSQSWAAQIKPTSH